MQEHSEGKQGLGDPCLDGPAIELLGTVGIALFMQEYPQID
jgi:hypothetical protein